MARNDPEAALPMLQIAEQADPADRRVLFLISRALTQLDRPEEAKPYLNAVRQHDELHQLASKAAGMKTIDDPQLCVEIGRRCLTLKRRLEAVAWFNAAIAIDPFYTEAQHELAQIEEGKPSS